MYPAASPIISHNSLQPMFSHANSHINLPPYDIAGLKVAKMIRKGAGPSRTLTVRFDDQNYGVQRFHQGRIVHLTRVARMGTTDRNLCFTARVQYCRK